MSKASNNRKTGPSNSKSTARIPGASKLDPLLALLRQGGGATIQELAAATAWQTLSVRGALAGTLRKKGHTISSDVVDGVRRYRIAEAKA